MDYEAARKCPQSSIIATSTPTIPFAVILYAFCEQIGPFAHPKHKIFGFTFFLAVRQW